MTNSKNLDTVWKDIISWQKEINSEDEALIRRKLVHDQTLPPVRKSTIINLDNSKPVGLDALKKTSSIPTSSIKPQTRAERAEAEKAKGNEYFGKKDYKNAILHYGKAIDMDPTVSVYFVNRAMAYLKVDNFLGAEKDCTRGIKLQPNNVKAYWRRGIALKGLGRINEARKDFETGLKIEPNNKSILDELKKLSITKTVEKPQVKNDDKKEPMIRLPINVIDDYYSKPKEAAGKIKESQPIKTKEVKPANKKSETKEPVTKKPETRKPETKQPETKQPETKQPETKQPESKSLEIKSSESKKSVEAVPSVQPSKAPIKFAIPHTNFEFERDWKTYKVKGDDVLYQYFQIIPPTLYASIFKSSLESDQFEKMIDLLQTKYTKEKNPNDILSVLRGLSQVKRIDMLIMFLDKKRQEALQNLFNILKDATGLKVTRDDLIKLSKFYDVRV
ncbi:MAG: hypothetical protein EXX96DRAFT_647232 [Benjaminiella poitrasii]|nr:MAG: hypothetical protein EXX96DRAFT_647232 [Benjaminiella poitrasii]